MVSENDNNQRRNVGRSQSSPLNVEQIKKQIEEGMNKGVQGKESKKSAEAINKSRPVEDLKEDIARKAEEKKKQEFNSNFTGDRRREISNSKIQTSEANRRQAKASGHKSEAEREAEKEVNKKLKEIGQGLYVKRKIVSKVVGKAMSEMAYAIAQKMATEANKGGLRAVVPIVMTYLIALLKDLIDFTGVGAILGILTGILCGSIIAMFWVQVSGGWKGGFIQKQLIKRIIIKIGLAAFIETLPGPNLIPTFIIMNLWSHWDFHKSIKKAKRDSKEFKTEFKKTGKINKKYANYA